LSPLERSAVPGFDEVADVVIVGFGAAGTCAAYESAALGAKTIVLERTGGAGGAAALAEGILYLGGGTSTQVAAGVEDSPEDFLAYLKAAVGPGAPMDKVEAYAAGALEHHTWLLERGLSFTPKIDLETQMAPRGDDGLVWSGGEDAYPFNEIAKPAPRGHLCATKNATGWLLMQTISAEAIRVGADVRYDSKVERLIVDAGRVVGVVARSFGEQRFIEARRGVVISAGGFIWNDDMLARYAPPLLRGTWKVGTEGDDGSGIEMAQSVGAAVRNMHAGEVSLPIIPPVQLTEGILVNGHGQRFINEDTYMGRVGIAALYEQDATCFLVVDEAAYSPNWMGVEASWVCESVTELEEEMGLAPGSLESTINLYNRHAVKGEDPLFHKRAERVRPLEGALGAFDLRPGSAPYAPFTLGGLETSVNGAVMGVYGEHIPGLFAAGRSTAGVCATGYASGLSIGDSTMFGRFAGRAAAQS